MSPRARFVLRWTFILAFLIITPAIILSTAGYRYNFAKNRLERTGVLIVDSKPSGASIFIDDKPIADKTPAYLSHLLPGTYRVRIEKDGFQPFSKEIDVVRRSSTFLNDVVLFRQGLPLLEKETAVRQSAFSPDGRYLAILSGQESWTELHVIDLKTGQDDLAYRAESASAPVFEFEWSNDASRLLIRRLRKDNPSYFIWDATLPEQLLDLQDIVYRGYRQAFWAADGDRLYAADAARIYEIDTRSRILRDVGPAAEVMQVRDGFVYGLRTSADGVAVVGRTLAAENFIAGAQLPTGSYRPLAGRRGLAGYADPGQKKIELIGQADGRPTPVFEGSGTDGAWSDDGARFVYWNDSELRAYDVSRNTDTLVTRLSTPIAKAFWHPTAPDLIVFATPQQVSTIDWRSVADKQAAELTEFSSLTDLAVTKDGASAFFVGMIGRQSGLWSLKLK